MTSTGHGREGQLMRHRRRITRGAAFVALLASIAAIVASSHQSAQAATTSSPTTPNQTCTNVTDPADGPHSSVTERSPLLPLTHGVADANMWNTSSSTGSIQQCYGPHGLTTSLALNSIKRNFGGPAGFPEASYGLNVRNDSFCLAGTSCTTSPFPFEIHKMKPSFKVTTRYSLGAAQPNSVARSFEYNFWIEGKPRLGWAPQPGDVEVIISLYHHGVLNCGPGRPNWSQRVTINGRSRVSRWRVCNLGAPPGQAANLVGFLLQNPKQATRRSIALQLKPFINRAIKQANTVFHAKRRPAFLEGIELGSEFGNCDSAACKTSAVHWQFTISKLALSTSHSVIPII
jgi:hypothetical protein